MLRNGDGRACVVCVARGQFVTVSNAGGQRKLVGMWGCVERLLKEEGYEFEVLDRVESKDGDVKV